MSKSVNKIVLDGQELNLSGGGTNKEVYSTEETVIGTWIDGKPIYRKVYTFGQVTGNVLLGTQDIDAFVRYCGYIANNDWKTLVPYGQGVDGVALKKSTNEIYLILSGTYSSVNSGIVSIEYTKTTDQATIELPTMLTSSSNNTLTTDTASVPTAAVTTGTSEFQIEEV